MLSLLIHLIYNIRIVGKIPCTVLLMTILFNCVVSYPFF